MKRREALTMSAAAAASLLALGATPRMASARTPEAAAARHATTLSEGMPLFVREWGTGKPVLFLAGWALPSDFWCYAMAHLAQRGHRVVAYDRRGHGRSPDPGRGYDHDTLADDLAVVIERLGIRDATVVAHSMGACELARYFTRHRGRGVSRIVLVGAITPFLMKTHDNPRGLDKTVLATLRAPLERDFPAWIAASTPPFFLPETSPEMIGWGQRLMLETSLLAAVALAQANAETDFRKDVRAIDVPTLLVHGDRDVSAPLALTAEPTAALIRKSRLVVYPGAPHGLPLTHMDRLNRDLLDFARER